MTFTGTLDNYQLAPKEKFLERKSLLVAYSMGLGKTPIAIAAAEELIEQGNISTVLIVCPASLKYQWAQKIAEFTDCDRYDVRLGKESITVPSEDYCIIIDGNKEARNVRYSLAIRTNPRYIIIGYDNVLIDFNNVKKISSGMVVLDEATAIKSFKAQRSKRIKRLLRSEYRLALTGTPVENKPDELFSIMQWVDEDVLGRYDLFEKAYINRNKNGWIVSYKNLPVLRKKLEPAVSRLTRQHATVREFMPEVNEVHWVVQADSATNELYMKIAGDMLAEMDKQQMFSEFNPLDYVNGIDESKPSGKLMGMYMCMEMLVNHPDLIVWSAMQYDAGRKTGSRYAYELWQSGELDNVVYSPKLGQLRVKTTYELDNDKILIYSKYKYMLQILEAELYMPGNQSCVQHHGSMSPLKKAEAIAKFRNDPDCRYFLSSHSGAYGLDMNMADMLINYDLPWSAGKQDQINSRHVRRSSQFDKVDVRNLIVKNTFEERRIRILDRKKRLGTSILDGTGSDDFGRIDFSGDSLRGHLTKAARHGIVSN